MGLFTKILGDPNKRELNKMRPIVDRINALEQEFERLSDDELRAKTEDFKQRLDQGESLTDLLPEAFAAVREAAKRTIGQRHYDVQLLAGMVLHSGSIAEMRTGEGKTLAATLPIYLNALQGRGAHLVTVNDYLAALHAEWMGRVYRALGLTTGCIQQQGLSYLYDPTYQPDKKEKPVEAGNEAATEVNKVEIDRQYLRPAERRDAYAADITYGTNNEFGFDYLRDNMALQLSDRVQRDLHYAIVDEVDSILIDEARTPLIISAPAQQATDQYYQFAKIVPRLEEGPDYNIDEKMRAATLTDDGITKIEQELGVDNLYTEGGIKLVHHLENALRAQTLFHKDKDYVVKEGEVVIVDEFTGRLMFGRRFADGLHQALEAKEGVKIQQESVTMATITFQNYFRLYDKLAGMTGTAKTEEEEFAKIYGLSVLVIPTNRPMVRQDKQDRIYKNEKGKFDAVIAEVKQRHELGQPVLLGTASIEKNELVSQLLAKAGVKHQMLNAKNHEGEAQIIAQAGQVGAVTVATNMAGRGVDIILGGNPPDKEQAEAVKQLGGLAVIGTERHESRRIDNQLRGRSGRQGDSGESIFFISTEDDLMRIFGSDRMRTVMDRLGVPDDMPVENKLISKSIESAQKKVEGHNFDARKHVVQYDDVINKHRTVIYGMRDDILASPLAKGGSPDVSLGAGGSNDSGSADPLGQRVSHDAGLADTPEPNNKSSNRVKIMDMVQAEIASVAAFHTAAEREEDWNLDEIYEVVDTIFPVPIEVRLKLEDIYDQVAKEGSDEAPKGRAALSQYISSLGTQQYERLVSGFEQTEAGQAISQGKEGELSAFERIEQSVLLRSIDTLWVEHLDAMDHLRQGIGLRGYGQRDPLIEYKREAKSMFDRLLESIRKQVVYSIYKIGQIAGSGSGLPIQDLSNIQLAGAQKTGEKGTGQFQGVTTTALPQAGGAQSSTIGGQSATVARFAKKTEGTMQAPVARVGDKIGRNDPCPCGSGKKYKKCGMLETDEHKKLIAEK